MSHFRHFLDMRDLSAQELNHILDEALRLKAERKAGKRHETRLDGRKLAMIFEKPSTRTRTSFEVGMLDLGGHALFMSKNDIQIGHGESIPDTARVLSRYVDAIMLRCHGHDTLTELAEYASIPVINGLTDYNHPCQLMADMLTLREKKGELRGLTICWVGDGNNVTNSFIVAAQRFGFKLNIACPEVLNPCAHTLQWARENGAEILVTEDVDSAVKGADVIVADTWVSMGQKDGEARKSLLAPYQVNEALMAKAAKDALFMHCLPAHRGEEVTDAVMDSAQSVVFDEAENRLHAQKAILLWCFKVI